MDDALGNPNVTPVTVCSSTVSWVLARESRVPVEQAKLRTDEKQPREIAELSKRVVSRHGGL